MNCKFSLITLDTDISTLKDKIDQLLTDEAVSVQRPLANKL